MLLLLLFKVSAIVPTIVFKDFFSCEYERQPTLLRHINLQMFNVKTAALSRALRPINNGNLTLIFNKRNVSNILKSNLKEH